MKKLFLALFAFTWFHVVQAQPDASKAQTVTIHGYKLQFAPDIASSYDDVQLVQAVLQQPSVQKHLQGHDYLILNQQYLPSGDLGNTTSQAFQNQKNIFQITIYDYTENKAISLTTTADRPQEVEINAIPDQPNPSDEEFERALSFLFAKDQQLQQAYKNGLISFYKPMPPLDLNQKSVNGSLLRTLTIGIESKAPVIKNEIVGLNMITQEVIHYPHGAPSNSKAAIEMCGIANARQRPTTRMHSGSYWLTISQNNVTYWRMKITRPAASICINASGIELDSVDYMGQRVFNTAHVPILNVKYDGDTCGPYRDWLYEENAFQATGTDAATGFRICTSAPETILQSGTDTGNFRGVAIYTSDSDVELISEEEAGWYRYVSEWHFFNDGRILPRFEFGSVKNSCVCHVHHHHVYWRFDFDIQTAGNNQAAEYNTNKGWKDINTEELRQRDSLTQRKWRVSNTNSGAGYTLEPGENDGTADRAFGVGDVWVLKYNPSEIDDGVSSNTFTRQKAEISKFLNSESVKNENVVIWYAAHFTHDIKNEEDVDHVVGPTLTPFNWSARSIAAKQPSPPIDHLAEARLEQNVPNPFNANSTIKYFLPENVSNGELIVSDLKGNSVLRFNHLSGGTGTVTIHGGALNSGEYEYSLIVDGKKIASRKMTLTK